MRPRLIPPAGARAAAALLLGAIAACYRANTKADAAALAHGNPDRGAALIQQYGCGSCHTIPGIAGANALVGPPLAGIASRAYIAGVLTNQPRNLIRWIEDPPGVDSLTAMPNLHVGSQDAHDIAAYLYTLR